MRVTVVEELAGAEALWRRLIPEKRVTDSWEVRKIFHDRFRRPLKFVVAENGSGPVALLPLSFIEETGGWGIFPGETWSKKTWLEQNPINLLEGEPLETLTGAVKGNLYLRYLTPETGARFSLPVDETGYLFRPPLYDFSYEKYLEEFSGKTRKKIFREIALLEERGVEIFLNRFEDAPLSISLNEGRFGENSYFADQRFKNSFLDLFDYFKNMGWLTVTTVVIGGEVAAVDVGCLKDGIHLVLAGGTAEGFPAVAKLINLHHIKKACEEKMNEVDFLCGDFTWKKIFHLTERPLYLVERKRDPA